jgi:hypothetical protein
MQVSQAMVDELTNALSDTFQTNQVPPLAFALARIRAATAIFLSSSDIFSGSLPTYAQILKPIFLAIAAEFNVVTPGNNQLIQ